MTKILVVDDEESILELLDDILTDDGFDVISAKNGATALAQIYRERPDVVLLDLMMPLVSGYQVLRELRAEPTTERLPVILLTAVSPGVAEQVAVELGANHYVSKPCKVDYLQAIIKVALREAGGGGWARPSLSHLQNVKQFQVGQPISKGGWRPKVNAA